MANSITTAAIYLAMLDAVYAASAKTMILDNKQFVRDGAQAGEFSAYERVCDGEGCG